MAEIGDPKSWEIAKKKAAVIGHPMPPFTRSIRSLLVSTSSTIDAASVRAFGTGVLRPLQIIANEVATDAGAAEYAASWGSIGKLYSKKFLAEAIALVYLCRRLKVLGIANAGEIISSVERYANVGIVLSRAMGRIPIADGAFLGAIRQFGYTLMAHDDPSKLKSHMDALRAAGAFYDLNAEITIWGCTHTQVVASLLPILGFPAGIGMAIHESLVVPLSTKADEENNHIRIVVIMLEALLRDVEIPELPGDEDYMIDESKTEALYAKIDTIRAGNSQLKWLSE